MFVPSLYSQKDYRVFLKTFYSAQKKQTPGYSFKKFSEKGQIGSPNILKLVMDGKKNLSTISLLKFAKALDLDDAETIFFEALVLENQATDPVEKKFYGKRIKNLQISQSAKTVHFSAKTVIYDHPLMPDLIVYLAGADVESALDKLEKSLPLRREEALKWIELLEAEQILTRKNKKFEIDFEHAVFTRKTSDLKLRWFLKSQLNFSNKAFDQSYTKNGKFFSHSMGIDRAAYPEVIGAIKKTIAEIN